MNKNFKRNTKDNKIKIKELEQVLRSKEFCEFALVDVNAAWKKAKEGLLKRGVKPSPGTK